MSAIGEARNHHGTSAAATLLLRGFPPTPAVLNDAIPSPSVRKDGLRAVPVQRRLNDVEAHFQAVAGEWSTCASDCTQTRAVVCMTTEPKIVADHLCGDKLEEAERACENEGCSASDAAAPEAGVAGGDKGAIVPPLSTRAGEPSPRVDSPGLPAAPHGLSPTDDAGKHDAKDVSGHGAVVDSDSAVGVDARDGDTDSRDVKSGHGAKDTKYLANAGAAEGSESSPSSRGDKGASDANDASVSASKGRFGEGGTEKKSSSGGGGGNSKVSAQAEGGVEEGIDGEVRGPVSASGDPEESQAERGADKAGSEAKRQVMMASLRGRLLYLFRPR